MTNTTAFMKYTILPIFAITIGWWIGLGLFVLTQGFDHNPVMTARENREPQTRQTAHIEPAAVIADEDEDDDSCS